MPVISALHNRNYRLFFAGQFVSLIGTWIQQIALNWLVYRITDSVFILGLFGFFGQIPVFFLTPFSGVLIDRLNRLKLIFGTQIILMLQAYVLAAVVLTGSCNVLVLFVLNIILGIVNALDMPARHSFVIDMLENRADLGNAIALNAFIINGTRLIGPAAAGFIIASYGEGVCFLINGASFSAIILALSAMKLKKAASLPAETEIWKDFRDGFAYVAGFPAIRHMIILVAMLSLMGMPFQHLMSAYAKDVLAGGPHTLGLLMACVGTGALAGSVYLALRKPGDMGNLIVRSAVVFGTAIIAASFADSMTAALCIMLFAGFGMMTGIASINTSIQTLTDDKMRGRVMGYYTMAFMGMTPFGCLIAGIMAGRLGVPLTYLLCGITCVTSGLVFGMKMKRLRQPLRTVSSLEGTPEQY